MKKKIVIEYLHKLAESHQIQLSEDDINKVLWYADSRSYLERGVSITGGAYIKGINGPVLK